MEDMFESLLVGQRLLASGFDLRLYAVIAIVGTLGIITFVYSLKIRAEVNENE